MAIPLWLRGIDISLVQVTLETVNTSTGVLADSVNVGTITAVLDGAGVRVRMDGEEISAITSTRENNVPTQIGYEIVLREILDRRASTLPSTGPVLAKLYQTGLADPSASPYAKVVITRGGNTWTGYGLFQSYDEGPYTKGRNVGEMIFVTVDNGASSLAYA